MTVFMGNMWAAEGELDLSLCLDVAFFAVLLYGPRYWLGCMHGTAVLVCSVFCGVEEN